MLTQMLARPLALLRTDRRAQIAAAVAVIGGLAFAWWTISPFFIQTMLTERSREAQVQVAAPASPGATGAPAGAARLIARGELQRVDDLHRGTGPVVLFELEGKQVLRFEDVAIQNGPDLHVYLGRGTGGAYDGNRDLYLGALKATNGTFTYDIPAGTRLADYKSVIVWCRAFVTLFTWADLKSP